MSPVDENPCEERVDESETESKKHPWDRIKDDETRRWEKATPTLSSPGLDESQSRGQAAMLEVLLIWLCCAIHSLNTRPSLFRIA